MSAGFAAHAGAAAQEEPALPRLCSCSARDSDDEIVVFTGVVVDAELVLDKTGLALGPRQATIFRVVSSAIGEVDATAKVWHPTDVKRCGVRFNYGAKYIVRAQQAGDALETDYCLMPRRLAAIH